MADYDTFIRVTNKDVYNELISLAKENKTQHDEIIKHLQYTNGKVRLNKWVATTALTLCITCIGWLLATI